MKNNITTHHHASRLLGLFILLMLTLGSGNVWGQTGTDYSGTYYIASRDYKVDKTTTNFYLCPTENWYYYQSTSPYFTDKDNDMPFMTTYQCRNGEYDASKAVWIIEKKTGTNYYYIKQATSGYYLTYNVAMGQKSNAGRMRIHLEASPEDDDAALFEISYNNTYSCYEIITKKFDTGTTRKYLNVTGPSGGTGNINQLVGTNARTDGPTDCKNVGGIIGLYTAGASDPNGKWYLEDVIPAPVIAQQDDNKIQITYSGTEDVTLYYTTDGSKPDPKNAGGDNPTQVYSDAFQLTESITTIKAIAVKAKEGNEPLDIYSRVATILVVRQSNDYPYLVQSQENTNYYMIPVTDTQNANGFTKTHTTTLGQPSMMWYFKNAGNVDGVQYYYMVNKSTGQYVYYHIYNSNQYMISINSAETFEAITEDEEKEPYRFSINEAEGGGYNICPKNDPNRSIYKNTSNKHNGYINAGSKTHALGRWNLISVTDEKMPSAEAPITVSTTDAATYYSIENEKQTGNYISPDTYVTVATSVTDNEKWCFVQAAKDDWLTYYFIVNATSGEYLYLNKTGTNAVKTGDLDPNNAEKFQFVLAPSATDGFYIIPRSEAIQKTRLFTSLYYYDTVPLQTASRRFWSDDPTKPTGEDAYLKWNFKEEVSLTNCQNPVFEDKEGKIILSCKTFASEIRYTNNGTTPTATTGTIYTDQTEILASNQHLIKAISILKNNTEVVSEVVTLFNKPTVTVEEGPHTYKAAAWEPEVTVSVGETEATTGFTVAYDDNINAGTARVTITDANATDTWYFLNVPLKEFTITPKPLSITANNKSIGYGDEPDNNGVIYGEFAGSETNDVLAGTLNYTYTTKGDDPHPYTPYDSQYGHVGDYNITPYGLSSTNYNITFVPGTLEVTKKSFGEGTLAEGFTIEFDEEGNVIIKYGTHILEDTDYTITLDPEHSNDKYSCWAITGSGNYEGSLSFKNAMVHFTTDTDQYEWSATFVAESSGASDIGHVLPEGISAYIISAIEGRWAIPEPLDYIPVGVPVLLVAKEAKNGFLVTDAKSGDVTEITDAQKGYNKLKEVKGESATFGTREIYVLYKNEFVLNMSGNLGKGKVYMENPNFIAPTPAPARLNIAWGNVTGIHDIQNDGTTSKKDEGWYTIDGRCLSGKPNVKGLYIVNGKKTIVK